MGSRQEAVPRAVANMQKAQVAHIALSRFGLPLSMRATLAEMVASVTALMKRQKFCPNSECGAGSANCDPAQHLFEPSEYLEDPENPPLESEDDLLEVQQLDSTCLLYTSPSPRD